MNPETLNPAIYAPDAERSVLGAILLDDQHLTSLVIDEHLRPDHFADPTHRAIFKAAVELQDAGRPIDHLTIVAQLRETGSLETVGGAQVVEGLTAWVPATGHAREYGRLVRERHQARELLKAAQQTQADVLSRAAPMEDLLERADQALGAIRQNGRHGAEQSTWLPGQLKDWYFDDLGQPAGNVWRTQFPALDELLGGGLAPGEQMLIGGDEKIGKSHLIDCLLDRFAEEGLSAHLYINEMSRRQRLNRMITRATGIPTRALKARNLTSQQSRNVAEAIKHIGVGITECQGWTAAEITRHIKRHKWDVCAVDIAHNITKTEQGTAGWDAIAQELRTAPVQVDGLMLLAVHLKKRSTGVARGLDVPILDDIRDSGMFAKLADQVLFVARERDEQGIPTNDGVLSLSAVRDGEPGLVKVTFSSSRLMFLPALSAVPNVIRADQYVPADSRIESGAAA